VSVIYVLFGMSRLLQLGLSWTKLPSFVFRRFAPSATVNRTDLIFDRSVSVTVVLAAAMSFFMPGILAWAKAKAVCNMSGVVCVASRLGLSLANNLTHMGNDVPRAPSLF
jgi:hypothetical protein